jgi:hypothetical protein
MILHQHCATIGRYYLRCADCLFQGFWREEPDLLSLQRFNLGTSAGCVLSNQVDTVTLRKGSLAPRAVIALGGV